MPRLEEGLDAEMYSLTVEELREITGGIIRGPVDPAAHIQGCVIDSRRTQSGDAFFALPGARQHGSAYCEDAFHHGAVVTVVDRTAPFACSGPHLLVGNSAVALAAVAAHNRRQSDALVIGVTGSVGKTTTRNLIAAVLGSGFTGIQSPANFNNHLGVPLSLLEIQPDDEFAVIELAASAPGELQRLCALTRAEFGVVTRVAPAHLRGFGSLQNVQKEKRLLVESLPASGAVFLNADDPLVVQMAASAKCRVISFGSNPAADLRAVNITASDHGISFEADQHRYELPMPGTHNVTNALAAVAIGREVGLEPQQIAAALSRVGSLNGRCRLLTVGDWNVIDDTYNSSPAGMTAAVRTLEQYQSCHHRIAVVGDMLDLGDQAPDLHYSVGAALANARVDHILSVGEFADCVAEGFRDSGGSLNHVSVFSDFDLLTTMLECVLSPGDAVLVKGSRGMRMERVIDRLRQLAATAEQSPARRAA
ncbi:MAG: UDP-N-acetylmuramoyl-tripeptide--D-alanyl-D-alanine ligase [Planctomycetaceae bacterium]|nr:UDP-N-acetylmuramoyl-tripeptide--D-alanyl-D-alanine ligase [Planctomycetaceae bacterium]